MEMKGIDLTKCRGLNFKANIEGKPCEGKIQVEGNMVYLCQNNMVGSGCDDKMGFRHSWSIIHGTEEDMEENYVEDFEIVPRDPETYKDWQVGDMIYREDPTSCIGMVIFRSGDFVAVELNGSCRCYTCAELFGEGYRLELTDIEKQIIDKKKVVEDILKLHEFRKGEPVLVRDYENSRWLLAAYSGEDSISFLADTGKFVVHWKYCIPYNESTMHLLGTTEDYKEES